MSNYISQYTGKQIDEVVGKVLGSDGFNSTGTVVVKLDRKTGKANYTPAELLDLFNQGKTVLLNASSSADDMDFYLPLSIDADSAAFYQMCDDTFYMLYRIDSDGTFSYSELSFITPESASSYLMLKVILNDTRANVSPKMILQAIQEGRPITLSYYNSFYTLSYCDEYQAKFLRVVEDGLSEFEYIEIYQDCTYSRQAQNLVPSECYPLVVTVNANSGKANYSPARIYSIISNSHPAVFLDHVYEQSITRYTFDCVDLEGGYAGFYRILDDGTKDYYYVYDDCSTELISMS